jgi:hypothetical protein
MPPRNPKEDMMRNLLVAAALGLGLLSAAANTAAAGPLGGSAPASTAAAVTPVHYQRGYDHRRYHRPRYVPPPRYHAPRYLPPRHDHSWRYHPQQFGWR